MSKEPKPQSPSPDPGNEIAPVSSPVNHRNQLATTTFNGPFADTEAAYRVGHYHLEQEIGRGGSGSVFRAIDSRNGDTVAVKLLRESQSLPQDALQRFQREAQILSKLDHPNVVRFIESGIHNGLQYIATEFVDGLNLASRLHADGPFDEKTSLRLVADMARALVSPHEQGIVHRDIKPENVLLCAAPGTTGTDLGAVKVADFGLARFHATESTSAVTQTGALVGTPAYMAPEQGGSQDEVEPTADVYSMGATLFHLLTGRPPFVERDAINLIMQHRHELAPRVTELNANISPATDELVAKTLSKRPSLRHANADELLVDLLHALDGDAPDVTVLPQSRRRSDADEQRQRSLEYEFRWDLNSAPLALWPLVSNTERLNEAIDLPAVDFESERDIDGVLRRYGSLRLMGMQLRWEEHPFEWIEGQKLAVEREFSDGPFRTLVSEVELNASKQGAGTALVHRITVQPRGVIGRAAATVEIGIKSRKALDRVYRRIDDAAVGRLDCNADAFRAVSPMKLRQKRRLSQALNSFLERHPGRQKLVADIERFIAGASSQELSRIRTLKFADEYDLDSNDVLEAFIELAHDGLFDLVWDVICPDCRVASEFHATLQDVQAHASCPACDLDFDIDFAASIELTFRISRQVRQANTRTYCVGGPGHAPHVCVQVRMNPSERIGLKLNLSAGNYLIRDGAMTAAFTVSEDATTRNCELQINDDKVPQLPDLIAESQHLTIVNRHRVERLVKIERDVPRQHVLSALAATSFGAFRQAFPHEVLSASQLVTVRAAGIVACRIDWGGDSTSSHKHGRRTTLNTRSALRRIAEHATSLGAFASDREGDVVVLAFCDSTAAVQAMAKLSLTTFRELSAHGARLAMASDTGPAYVSSNGDRLECYGPTPDSVQNRVEHVENDCLSLGSQLADECEGLALSLFDAFGNDHERDVENNLVFRIFG